MKKVLSFIGCAMFVAAMTVSCSQKAAETNDSVCDSTVENAVVENAVEQVAPEMTDAEHAAMLDAAREAGRAKCNCYKTDAASVESCIKSILSSQYAAYENNQEFLAAMDEEFNSCVKEKATEVTKKAVDEGVKAGAKALSEKLGKK
ncbi:MAG: hypothetical protein IKM79_00240 [Bacteroidales bacterium]|nr:hypothetical protein [Bacteroidales bacterium]